MLELMITDFAEIRWSPAELHAWALGDVAALEGVRRIANPYTKPEEHHLHVCWDQGHCGWPLAGVSTYAQQDTTIVPLSSEGGTKR